MGRLRSISEKWMNEGMNEWIKEHVEGYTESRQSDFVKVSSSELISE